MSPLSERDYAALLALVRARTGLVFPDTRRANLEDGVLAAMAEAGVGDLARYLLALERGKLPIDDLVDRITVGETYFYREPAHFELVRNEVLPAIERRGRRDLRAWSAGCASGEEPYTLAMLLLETGYASGSSILATDLSPAALERARRGCYRTWSLRGSAPALVERHLSRQGQLLCVDDNVKRLIELRRLNLADPGWPSAETGTLAFDLILCRNVLIYLSPEAIDAIARRFYDALVDGGWLLLGPSDPSLEGMAPFEVEAREGGLCYRRQPLRVAPSLPRRRPAPSPSPRKATPPKGNRATVAPRRQPVVPPRPRAPSPRRTPPAPAAGTPSAAAAGTPSAAAAGTPSASAAATPSASAAGTPSASAAGTPSAAAAGTLRATAAGTPSSPASTPGAPVAGTPPSAASAGAHPPATVTPISSDETTLRALANSAGSRVAERTLRDVLRKSPMSPELHYLHALMLTNLGRPREAVEAVRRVIYLAPDRVVAHLLLALLRRQEGALTEARRALQVAASLLAAQPADAPVPLGDGASVGQVAAMVARELHDLGEPA